MIWNFDDYGPVAHGWYAVLVCYDAQEGVLPAAAYWSGKWGHTFVVAFGDRCNTKDEAEALAMANQVE